MKTAVLILALITSSAFAQDELETDNNLTDQQRCEEWAEMDGIEAENKADYMQECLQNLNYAEQDEEANPHD